MTKPVVTIYSKPGCHLCDEAKAAMRAAGCEGEYVLEEIDIRSDPDLLERFRFEIPVVFIDGVKAFKYHVEPREFRRRIARRTDQR